MGRSQLWRGTFSSRKLIRCYDGWRGVCGQAGMRKLGPRPKSLEKPRARLQLVRESNARRLKKTLGQRYQAQSTFPCPGNVRPGASSHDGR